VIKSVVRHRNILGLANGPDATRVVVASLLIGLTLIVVPMVIVSGRQARVGRLAASATRA
jgi:hypothetical protein